MRHRIGVDHEFVGAFVLSFALTLGLVSTGQASAACSETPDRHNINYAEVNDYSLFGVRTEDPSMLVLNDPISCGRVSSIGVAETADTYVEIGWMENPQGRYDICEHSQTQTLLVYMDLNGSISCKQNTAHLDDNTRVDLTVTDSNGDTIWQYFRGNNSLGTYDATFTGEPGLDNSERLGSDNDPVRADFQTLGRRRGSGTSWTNWEETIKSADDITGWKGCKYEQYHTGVIHQNANCP